MSLHGACLELWGSRLHQKVHEHGLAHAHATIHVQTARGGPGRGLGCGRRMAAPAKQARQPSPRLGRGRLSGVHQRQAPAPSIAAPGVQAQEVPHVLKHALQLPGRQRLPGILREQRCARHWSAWEGGREEHEHGGVRGECDKPEGESVGGECGEQD